MIRASLRVPKTLQQVHNVVKRRIHGGSYMFAKFRDALRNIRGLDLFKSFGHDNTA